MVNGEVNIGEAVFDYKTALQDGTVNETDEDVLIGNIKAYLELGAFGDVVEIEDDTEITIVSKKRITKQDLEEFGIPFVIRYMGDDTTTLVEMSMKEEEERHGRNYFE